MNHTAGNLCLLGLLMTIFCLFWQMLVVLGAAPGAYQPLAFQLSIAALLIGVVLKVWAETR